MVLLLGEDPDGRGYQEAFNYTCQLTMLGMMGYLIHRPPKIVFA
jgi:hypothetical protein